MICPVIDQQVEKFMIIVQQNHDDDDDVDLFNEIITLVVDHFFIFFSGAIYWVGKTTDSRLSSNGGAPH